MYTFSIWGTTVQFSVDVVVKFLYIPRLPTKYPNTLSKEYTPVGDGEIIERMRELMLWMGSVASLIMRSVNWLWAQMLLPMIRPRESNSLSYPVFSIS